MRLRWPETQQVVSREAPDSAAKSVVRQIPVLLSAVADPIMSFQPIVTHQAFQSWLTNIHNLHTHTHSLCSRTNSPAAFSAAFKRLTEGWTIVVTFRS